MTSALSSWGRRCSSPGLGHTVLPVLPRGSPFGGRGEQVREGTDGAAEREAGEAIVRSRG